MTPNTISHTCSLCGKTIHGECDRFQQVKKSHINSCPKCKNIDIRTGKEKAIAEGSETPSCMLVIKCKI